RRRWPGRRWRCSGRCWRRRRRGTGAAGRSSASPAYDAPLHGRRGPMAVVAAAPSAAPGEVRPDSGTLGPAKLRRGRLEFLDALRGIAAMAVALQHGAELLWPGYLRWSVEVFRPGELGVFV